MSDEKNTAAPGGSQTGGAVIRRILLTLLLAALIIPATSATAAKLETFKFLGGFYNGGSNYFNVFSYTDEEAVGGTRFSTGCLSIDTPAGHDVACGEFSEATLDPTASVGRLVASFEGEHGPLTFEATFLRTVVDTANPPAFGVVRQPGQLTVSAWAAVSLAFGEFLLAKVTSGVGNFEASNVPALAATQTRLMAP